jgi:DNA-binding NtrC family response regulator
MSQKPILVVDDDNLSRTALVDLLERHGHEPMEADSGEKALTLFRAGSFLAVITDLKMPGIDGLELLRRLRELDTDVPVILVTAYGSIETAVDAMKRGASDYVTKPFSTQEILAALSRQLDLRALRAENAKLRRQVSERFRFGNIVGNSTGMKRVFELIETVADSLSTVLIQGESGTGKELVARALHVNSSRSSGPFVAVSCAALTESLLESELFGHERGAFTGATAARPGRVELANGGTLFLDDVDDIPLSAQVKLLRVLQEREVERVGTVKPRKVDVRLVAATKVDLRELVDKERFRDDLYYRLSVIPLQIPPLRERGGDVPLLVQHFLRQFAERDGRDVLALDPRCMGVLESHPWPGNVRELENVIERLAATCSGPVCGLDSIPLELADGQRRAVAVDLQSFPDGGLDLIAELDKVESRIIRMALAHARGNKSQTARLLKLRRSTLVDHMGRLGLTGDGKAATG